MACAPGGIWSEITVHGLFGFDSWPGYASAALLHLACAASTSGFGGLTEHVASAGGGSHREPRQSLKKPFNSRFFFQLSDGNGIL
jgi:hypothetical protein